MSKVNVFIIVEDYFYYENWLLIGFGFLNETNVVLKFNKPKEGNYLFFVLIASSVVKEIRGMCSLVVIS